MVHHNGFQVTREILKDMYLVFIKPLRATAYCCSPCTFDCCLYDEDLHPVISISIYSTHTRIHSDNKPANPPPSLNPHLIQPLNYHMPAPVLLAQLRVPLPHHHQRLHARRPRSIHLLDIIAQKQPALQRLPILLPFRLRLRATKPPPLKPPRDALIALPLHLRPRRHRIVIPAQQPRQVPIRGVRKQQLLRGHGPRAVDDEAHGGGSPGAQRGRDVGKQRAAQGAAGVAPAPEVALEGLEIGDLEVAGGQVVDVGAEGGRRGAVFCGEGVAVGEEVGAVPVGGEGGGEGGEGVGELFV